MTDKDGNVNLVYFDSIDYEAKKHCINKSEYSTCKYFIKINSKVNVRLLMRFLKFYANIH